MNRRIRKKKGLLKDLHYHQMKKELFQAMEAKAAALEELVTEKQSVNQ